MLTQICQSFKASQTYFHLNSSASGTATLELVLFSPWARLWYFSRQTMNVFSSSVRKLAVSGKS